MAATGLMLWETHEVPDKPSFSNAPSLVKMTKGDSLVHEVLGYVRDQVLDGQKNREKRAIDVENKFRIKDPAERGEQRARE